jgi:hypothetical protein
MERSSAGSPILQPVGHLYTVFIDTYILYNESIYQLTSIGGFFCELFSLKAMQLLCSMILRILWENISTQWSERRLWIRLSPYWFAYPEKVKYFGQRKRAYLTAENYKQHSTGQWDFGLWTFLIYILYVNNTLAFSHISCTSSSACFRGLGFGLRTIFSSQTQG